ncbi:MAG: hypothetical protein CSA62_03375 [Planctomycetota bacterium]|nr:MAG: hypothetical protein CSA62_03375 [Planctomycetota bacterium]
MIASSLKTLFALTLLLLAPVQDSYRQAQLALVGRDYQSAITQLQASLDALPEDAGPEAEDRLRFLLANTRLLAGERQQAQHAFEGLIAARPDSAYRHLARFGIVGCLEDAGEYQKAAALYQEEVARILSVARRMALAKVYLEQSEKALAREPIDYKAAIAFLDLAVQLRLPRAESLRLGQKAAKVAFDAKDWRQAAQRFERIVRDLRGTVYGSDPKSGRGKPALEERLWLARSWRRMNKLGPAQRLLEDLLRSGLEEQLAAEARFELALSYGVPQPGIQLSRGIDALGSFLSKHEGHEKAPQAMYLLAQSEANLGRVEAAISTIDRLLKQFADAKAKELPLALSDKAMLLTRLNKFDQATAVWQQFLRSYPAHGRWMQAQRAIVDLAYKKAELLRQAGQESYDQAFALYESFLDKNPLDARAAAIVLKLAKMREQQKRYQEAKSIYERCASKYPRSKQGSEARYRIGRLYEGELFDYERAIETYKKVRGSFASSARQRMRLLREESLKLETERVYQSDESAKVKVRTRNLKSLRVRIYKLDLANFHRGTMGRGEIRSLAVEVIEPDKTFESKTPEYRKYQESERELKLPFTGQGAYVVKVDGGDLEASSLVLVSDVSIISKSSREELFVYAQNTRTNQVAAGVDVLVTDGRKVVAEGKTGSDGVWRYRGKELENRDQLYILASSAEGGISTTLDLRGLQHSKGLQPRYHVYSDRTTYRPGEELFARAVLRDVERGLYIVPKRKVWELQLFDNSERMVASQPLRLSQFGTVHASFRLPEDASMGRYTLRLYDVEKRRVLGSHAISVLRYNPPRVSLSIDAKRPVIVRGEKISGTVKARYFFGGPVVGKKVTVRTQIRGPQLLSGTTDAAGEFSFSFDSSKLWDRAQVIVQAQIPEEQAQAASEYRVERTGFRLALDLPGDLYLAGEDLEAQVRVTGHDAKKLARKLVMELSRLETQKGRVSELAIARQEIRSDGKTGQARARFQLAKGGRHRLRVYGLDRFEQRIEASKDFFVSGEEDEVKLRILSNVQFGKVGDKIDLRIINRAGPRLCLITNEGGQVLSHQSRLLAQGETRIELELEERHAPNFAYAVHMIDLGKRKLHSARKEFQVAQPLSIRILPKKTKLLPGGKLGISIEAKDSAGRPVQGEFSLAFVDQAEIDLWGEDPRKIYDVFYGQGIKRSTDMRLASSCTFRYAAQTTKVNQAIREVEREEGQEEILDMSPSGARDLRGGMAGMPGRLKAKKRKRVFSPNNVVSQKVDDGAGNFNFAPATGSPGKGLSLVRGVGGISGSDLNGFGQRTGGLLDPHRVSEIFVAGAAFGLRAQTENGFGQQMEIIASAASSSTLGQGDRALAREIEKLSAASHDSVVWLPAVETDAEGKAQIEVSMPQRSTQWRLRVQGVSKGQLFGDASSSVVTKSELLAQGVLPLVLTEGDRAEARIDLHNLGMQQRDVEWQLQAGALVLAKGSAKIAGQGHVERKASLSAKTLGKSQLLLRAKSGELADASLQSFEVLPWGIEERVVKSGRLAGRIDVPLQLPKGEYRARKLVIEVGPNLPEDLLPFGGLRSRMQLSLKRSHYLAPSIGNRAAMGLAALVLLEGYGEAAPAEKGRIQRLRSQVEAVIAGLLSCEQGGRFYWIGGARGRKSFSIENDLVAALFLMRAQQAGFRIDSGALYRVSNWLKTRQREVDGESATFAFLALAVAGKGDFARFNSLYRKRASYGLGALGRLALAAHLMGRPNLALELEARIVSKLDLPQRLANAESVSPAQIAERLWALLALSKGKGYASHLARGEEWFQQTRRPWGYSNALALALGVEFLSARRRADSKLPETVTVSVGTYRKVLDFDKEQVRRRIVIPARDLGEGRVVLRLESAGRGELSWSAVLSALTREMPKSDPKVQSRIVRTYLQAPRILDNRPLPSGFSCLNKGYKKWLNKATAVALGESIDVQLSWRQPSEGRSQHGSVVIEEPLPAGCVVRLQEVRGNFDHVEMGAGFLRFYLNKRHRATQIHYSLRGFLPGQYRVLPTHVYSLEGSSLNEYGAPAKIRVLARGEESPDQRRATPDEVFEHGKRIFDALSSEEMEQGSPRRSQAWTLLFGLYQEYRNILSANAFRELARRLLTLALAREDAKNTVLLFEALKDRDEDYVLSFEKTAKVADAYYRSGEFEQSLRICKAIAETAFLKEMQIAGTLDRLGELRSSVDFVASLSLKYPALPVVRGALYSLASSLTLKASELEARSSAYDPRVGTSLDLRQRARQLCYEYLVRYPGDADADEVLFTLASIALEADHLDEAIALLRRGAKAHPQSEWLDDFLYLEGYAWFEKREREKALRLLDRVVTEKFRNAKGRLVQSPSRDLALFLQGQIYHAAGNPERALKLYSQVKKRFNEAREASDFFQAKRLKLPEFHLVKPNEPSRMKLKLRNLERAKLIVYQVDLMRLYLLRKSLSDMGEVQLFGIAPIHEEELDLKHLAKYREHEIELSLPMRESGAFLVLVQSGALRSSGLLLRTNLEVEAQERVAESRLRVNVKRDGVFLPQAQVKVVGSRDGRIRSGETDLRGIYIADDLRGKATVLVKDGESYAFYRSVANFGPLPRQQQIQQESRRKSKGSFDALQMNSLQNIRMQNSARQQLKGLFLNPQKGVEIRRSK